MNILLTGNDVGVVINADLTVNEGLVVVVEADPTVEETGLI